MKIELLKNTFRGCSHPEAPALAATQIVPRKRGQLPVASTQFDKVNGAFAVDQAKLLALMSKIFNPQCMTQNEAEGLISLLQDADVLAKQDVCFLRGQMREEIEHSGVVDLIVIVRSVMPASSNKDDLLAILNNIVGPVSYTHLTLPTNREV